jgi:hypothetical protein
MGIAEVDGEARIFEVKAGLVEVTRDDDAIELFDVDEEAFCVVLEVLSFMAAPRPGMRETLDELVVTISAGFDDD